MKTFDKYITYAIYNIIQRQAHSFINSLKINLNKTLIQVNIEIREGTSMSSEDKGRASYLDLLINTLMEHEKNLDRLIERLEKIYENLQEIHEKREKIETQESPILKEKEKPQSSEQDALIYMKLKLGRKTEDIIRIIESLKE